MLPLRFWKRDGGTLDASVSGGKRACLSTASDAQAQGAVDLPHSLLIRLSPGGEVPIFMSSDPATPASLSPANGSLSPVRWLANGSWDCIEGLSAQVNRQRLDRKTDRWKKQRWGRGRWRTLREDPKPVPGVEHCKRGHAASLQLEQPTVMETVVRLRRLDFTIEARGLKGRTCTGTLSLHG